MQQNEADTHQENSLQDLDKNAIWHLSWQLVCIF